MSTNVETAEPVSNPSVLPPWQMQVVGLAAVLVATVLIFWAASSPAHFELPIAQFFACVGIALYLAIFFYVFWPQRKLEAKIKPFFATKEFRVAGPIVLFFMALGIIWTVIPKPERVYAQIFAPDEFVGYNILTSVERKDKKPLTYHLIQSRVDPIKLEGIYVEFPPGENTIEAVFTHHNKRVTTYFTRGNGQFGTEGEKP
ncbi:MAG: hypothetical protein R3B84_00440 [Zavarzinella sp.]